MQCVPHHSSPHIQDPWATGALAGWRDYPVGVSGCNLIANSERFQRDQITRLSRDLFSDEVQIQLIDIREDRGKLVASMDPGIDWEPDD